MQKVHITNFRVGATVAKTATVQDSSTHSVRASFAHTARIL